MVEHLPPQQPPGIYKWFQELMVSGKELIEEAIWVISLPLLGLLTAPFYLALGLIEKSCCGKLRHKRFWPGDLSYEILADDADGDRYDYPSVTNLAWHPYENIVSFTTSDGELFIYANFVSNNFSKLLEKPLQPAPFIHDPLSKTSGNESKIVSNGYKGAAEIRHRRRGTPDTLDDLLGPDSEMEGDDFVSDDDGAGYLDRLNVNGKRDNDHLDRIDGFNSKRIADHQAWKPRLHQPFQPGSTPWRGQRRYLCKQNLYAPIYNANLARPQLDRICMDS